MRTLDEITAALRRNEPVTFEELRYTVAAYDVLLARFGVHNYPVLMEKYFIAAEMDPWRYVGAENDPENSDVVAWHKAFKVVEEGVKNERT